MKLLDVNLLIYAVDEGSAHFDDAHPWVEAALGGRETVAIPWVVLLAFLRLTTKPQVMTAPLHVEESLDVIDGWLARPNTVVVHPTERHAAVLRELRDCRQPRDRRTPGGVGDRARGRAELMRR
jgi:toxin-antitoxin system PIN domain toxin